MGEVKRKGRTAMFTILELLESQRFKIAVDCFDFDKSFMKAILTELLWECTNVVRSTMCKVYNNHSSLSQFEMLPLLRSTNEFNTYNIFWGMSEIEKLLYQTDPKHQMSKEEKAELLEKVRIKFMESESPKIA